MKTIKIDQLTVTVTYTVGYGGVDMPEEVYKQLLKANEKGDDIESVSHKKDYQEASEWLTENVKEGDCYDWKAEIRELSE